MKLQLQYVFRKTNIVHVTLLESHTFFNISSTKGASSQEFINLKSASSLDTANHSCTRRGEHLPSITTKQDNELLASFMKAQHIDSAWIAMRRTESFKLQWMDGTELSITL